MPDKHRGAVDFSFPDGAFRSLSAVEPFQLHRVFEREIPHGKTMKLTIPEHMKMLLLCLSGEGHVKSESLSSSVSAQSLIFCTGDVCELHISSSSKTLRCMCLLFDVALHDEAFGHTDLASLATFYKTCTTSVCVEETGEYRRVFSAFLSELCMPEPTMQLVKGFFYQVLIMAYRQMSCHSPNAVTESIGMHVVGQTVYAIIRYIDAHLFSINNLMDMAKELGYSYNYLSHLFRRKTGMTIQSYVTQKKIEQSTKLLADEQYSVTEIAAMLNYDCIQSFSKAFRRAMQMSPTEYRALCLRSKSNSQ